MNPNCSICNNTLKFVSMTRHSNFHRQWKSRVAALQWIISFFPLVEAEGQKKSFVLGLHGHQVPKIQVPKIVGFSQLWFPKIVGFSQYYHTRKAGLLSAWYIPDDLYNANSEAEYPEGKFPPPQNPIPSIIAFTYTHTPYSGFSHIEILVLTHSSRKGSSLPWTMGPQKCSRE